MMTMAPGIEAAAAGPHGRAAAAAAAAAAAWYGQGTYEGPQMHHSVQASAPGDPANAGHPAAHGGHDSFFASSADAASRYYQMHYESAASQGN